MYEGVGGAPPPAREGVSGPDTEAERTALALRVFGVEMFTRRGSDLPASLQPRAQPRAIGVLGREGRADVGVLHDT